MKRGILRSFKFPPDLWALVEENIPAGERTAIVQACLKREALRRKREAEKAQERAAE
jgi:hypothetical protein